MHQSPRMAMHQCHVIHHIASSEWEMTHNIQRVLETTSETHLLPWSGD